MPHAPRRFDDVTAITAEAPAGGAFTAEVDPDWTIGGKPNGGYLLAALARAAVATAGHEHVLSASTHYLHSPDPGTVELTTSVLRKGRTADHVRVQMSQGGTPCVESTFMVGTLRTDATPYWDAGAPAAPTPPAAVAAPAAPTTPAAPKVTHGELGGELGGEPGGEPGGWFRVPGTSPTGVSAPIFDQVDLRLDPGVTGFARGRPSGAGELRGWLRLPEDEPFDPVALLYAVDALPPATFEVAPTGWVPTLEMTTYVRALPAPGPVTVLHRAQLIEDQRVDEVTTVFDSRGRLVAQATQLAGIRLG
ncbi:thioesterase superfamily protein [Mumia flava]|uniref:Thioesterase superfamily protein n=1 Tax=Mumia flava TaxID=1348852 RepID=A0A0B2B6S7_9ACTN|nr:thioesterase family protein [Mumia flava]PJJ53812.1 thioesterase superfamily protein [Mumia flava]